MDHPPRVVSEASAPGKLILFGEHAVVYGATAIAGALSDLRASTRVELTDTGRFRVGLPEGLRTHPTKGSFEFDIAISDLLAAVSPFHEEMRACADLGTALRPLPALISVLEKETADCGQEQRKAVMPVVFLFLGIFAHSLLPPVSASAARAAPAAATTPLALGADVTVFEPSLPIGAGLGSSAAFSVSTAAALMDAYLVLAGTATGLLSADSSSTSNEKEDVTRPPSHHSKSSVGSSGEPKVADSPADGAVAFEMPSSPTMLSRVNDWAYCAEMLFHGTPSGLDNTVATYGGAIAYARPSPVATTAAVVPTTEAAAAASGAAPPSAPTALQPVPQKAAAPGGTSFSPIAGMPLLRLLITNTRVPKSTRALVGGVRVLHDALPQVIEPVIRAIDHVSAACLEGIALHSEHRRLGAATAAPQEGTAAAHTRGTAIPELSPQLHVTLDRLIRVNHGLLAALGVSHEALEAVASTMRAVSAPAAGSYGGCGPLCASLGSWASAPPCGSDDAVEREEIPCSCSATLAGSSPVASGLQGGLATKLTGAGGGGCAVTLLPPRLEWVGAPTGQATGAGGSVRAAAAGDDAVKLDTGAVGVDPLQHNPSFQAAVASLRARGWDVFETRLGGAGVLVKRQPRGSP